MTTSTTGHRGRGEKLAGKDSSDSKGFTLLELILVMVIISTVLAMASPSLRGFFASRETSDAAAQIVSLTQLARSQAIAEGRIYRLNLDLEQGAYHLTVREGGAFRELYTEFGRVFLLPDDTIFELEKDGEEGVAKYIDFFPQGHTEASTMRLTDRRGDVYEIVCYSSAERFQVIIPEKEV
jgi:type II secretion system protein H